MRKELEKEITNISNTNLLLELPTGLGKSKLALDFIKGKTNKGNLLIVINRIVHKENWLKEIAKWWNSCNFNIYFVCYASLHKEADKQYDAIIYDEAHHLSERCLEILPYIKGKYNVFLSATLSREKRYELNCIFENLYCMKVSTRKAINENVLPDPEVLLIKLSLDNKIANQEITINPKGCNPITILYKQRFGYMKQKQRKVIIKCTEKEYMEYLDSKIEFFKNSYMRSRKEPIKFRWLSLCNDRLKWLANIKTPIVKMLLNTYLKNERVLTFCSSIEQTEALSKNCINSKNKESLNILEQFNNGKINHITACNILNEGINLTSCRIGLFAILNASEIVSIQKIGRILRHEKPLLIIPYFPGTREEELLDKMLENCNKDLIHHINKNTITNYL